jgi:hypothetical protein
MDEAQDKMRKANNANELRVLRGFQRKIEFLVSAGF